MSSHTQRTEQAWKLLQDTYNLTQEQMQQFQTYLDLLLQWNEQINLTAITQPHQILLDHFLDSLSLTQVADLSQIHSVVDVGTGGGFPGIPLKIVYPHVHVTLIEVTGKKIAFLRTVIEQLGLEDIDLYTLDWRTFLRKTDDSVDLFVSRASLAPQELLRVFKPSSAYKNAQLVYWASKLWQPNEVEAPYIRLQHEYQIGNKTRKLVTFANQP